jgi:hypothetical protein
MEPTQPPTQCALRTVYPEVKQPDREAEHSVRYIVEVTSDGAILPLPHTPSWRSNQLSTGEILFLTSMSWMYYNSLSL